MNEQTTYYKFESPEAPLKSQGYDLVGYGYKGFIVKIDGLYLFWQIETTDGSSVPTQLAGGYTTQSLAKKAIDDFLRDEELKQRDYEASLNTKLDV